MTTSHVNDQELLDPALDPRVHLAWGTVGWPGDPDVLDGHGKDFDDGVTLVKVTLFQGAPPRLRTADDGGANGIQVRVQPAGPGWRVPPRGTHVMVGFAAGDIQTPGNGLILGERGRSPSKHFGRQKVVMDFGASDVVITGRSVTLLVDGNPDGETDKQKRHLVSVSPDGGAQVASGGCGLFVLGKDASGKVVGEAQLKAVDGSGNLASALVLAQDSAALSCLPDPASPAAVNLKGGNITITGSKAALQTGSVALGAMATPATPVQIGPAPMSGTPSSAVYAAP